MRVLKKNVCLFVIGGCAYAIIELLWRGRTHITMVIAGGLSLILFSIIENRFFEKSLALRAVLCSLAVTAIELLFGILFNLIFDMKIWDYSDQPFNLFGQICPLFSFLWAILSAFIMPVVDMLNGYFEKDAKLYV